MIYTVLLQFQFFLCIFCQICIPKISELTKKMVFFHFTTLRYTTLHYTTLHYTTLHYTTLHYTTPHSTTLHYTTLHFTTLHYTTLLYTTLEDSKFYYIITTCSRRVLLEITCEHLNILLLRNNCTVLHIELYCTVLYFIALQRYQKKIAL